MASAVPTVSVVTPFYNTAEYLAECIESVLAQTAGDFEYVLADNASTDGSREIAEEYARKDPRIRLFTFEEHLPQIPNYNRALRQADARARYCKIAQADDLLLPRCLEEMVVLADSDPEIAMVGSYTVLQNSVFLDGLDYYERVLPGAELCRRYLLDGPYIFGSPTTHMYRTADVKARDAFYDETAPFADADVAMRLLIGRKFGFVHQALSFVRTSNDSISTRRKDFHVDALTRRILLEKYGDRVLDPPSLEKVRKRLYWRHHRVLGEGLMLRRPAAFWDVHKGGSARAGIPIDKSAVLAGALVVSLRMLANPERTARSLWGWLRSGR